MVFWIVITLVLVDVLFFFPRALHRLVLHDGLRPAWLAWVPLANTYFVARAADASPFSVVLFFIPLVDLYVWWDCWSEIAFDHHHPRANRWALGLFVPYLGSYLVTRLVHAQRPRAELAPAS
jgi:hypothetical protein